MALKRERMRLGDLLIRQGMITQEQLDMALQKQKGSGKKLGEVLVDEGYITEDLIVRALQLQLGLEVVTLTGMQIPDDVLDLVSGDVLRKYVAIPFERDTYHMNVLHLAMADPMDLAALDDIAIITGMQIEPYIASSREVLSALDKYFGSSETLSAARRYTKEREAVQALSGDEAELDEEGINDSPIVQLVRSLVEQAIRQRASDIHIESGEETIRVRFRIDGALYNRMTYENSLLPAISTRIKIMSGMDISEKRRPQDGRMTVEVDRQEYDIRVSTIPTVYGEKIVLRLSSKLALSKSKTELGLTKEEMETFDKLLESPYGLILVTGPTGSGKSTTMYTALKELNQETVNIITVEDPVEAAIEGISQIQVNPKAEVTFARALRAILRQDPDIIMIGEIRDEETASIAVQASITGHLVLSTLHTNNAASTLSRLSDMGVERYLLADAVKGVIAQRLVRKLCPHCKKIRPAAEAEKKLLNKKPEDEVMVYDPVGCPICEHTGYFGRTAVFEILKIDDEIHRLISGNGETEDIMRAALKGGMKTLGANAARMVLDGVISIEEMVRASYED